MNQVTDQDPTFARAVELHQLGRLIEAEHGYRQVLSDDADNIDALHLLGLVLMQLARANEAVPLLEDAIARRPDQATLHAALARAHLALGHPAQAIPCMERAVSLDAHAVEHQSDLGAMLQTEGQLAEARRIYERLIERRPQHIISRYNLATVAHREGSTDEAISLIESVVRDHPGHAKFRTTLAGYLLEAGRVDASLTHCNAALDANPRDLMAMTLKSVALLRSGQTDAARDLLDLNGLIRIESIQPPPGYATVDEFNADLGAHVLNHPTLEHERKANATRNGMHTDNLLIGERPECVRTLARTIRHRIAAYLQTLPHQSSHPFLARRPPRWRLQAWAVVMQRLGHQLPHTHPDGWVSGVYYVQIPQRVRSDDPGHEGWIEFGRPLPNLIADTVAQTRLIQPRQGLLVLFPSYLYHQTIPFDDTQQRISIAFDAVPY